MKIHASKLVRGMDHCFSVLKADNSDPYIHTKKDVSMCFKEGAIPMLHSEFKADIQSIKQ